MPTALLVSLNLRIKMTDIEIKLIESSEYIQSELVNRFKNVDSDISKLIEAQKYSLLNAGKRIRPFLVLEFCRMLGGSRKDALEFAMAIEMVHTFSLIHDDLPCMDDDSLRRGKPTNHTVYGEDFALLAGDAMLTEAFLVMSESSLPAENVQKAIRLLATASGSYGMAGGQAMDLLAEGNKISFGQLLKLHSLKTGALIVAAARLGCLAAGYDETTREYKDASAFAENVGLSFQVVDDILDVEGDAALLGKNIGSDAENQKTTFLSFMSVEEAKAYAEALNIKAKESIEEYPLNKTLLDLAEFLTERKY